MANKETQERLIRHLMEEGPNPDTGDASKSNLLDADLFLSLAACGVGALVIRHLCWHFLLLLWLSSFTDACARNHAVF